MALSKSSRRDLGQKKATRRALWVSTSLSTHGGIATYVRNMRGTTLWLEWDIHHIATHCNGSALARLVIFLKGLGRFVYELSRQRVSVVHIHTSSYGSFARKSILTWISALFQVPVILHVHGSEFHQFFEKVPKPAKLFIRATLERADAVIALGEIWARRLELIAPDANIAVVPNAIRLSPVVDQSDRDPIHVLFLGEVCERKGTFLLLESWARLFENCPSAQARLSIVGNGDNERAHSIINKLGIRDCVEVRGWLSPSEVQGLLANTQILVLPSLNEGQPMAILEAMARGICVVASNSGGIPEMLGDASGILVDPLEVTYLTQAIERVITDHEARHLVGTAARERIEKHFNIDIVCRQLDSLYHDVS
ncbi:glycosyltransferase family 4 protein [Mycolicibacterium hippocampi]|uniref:Polysaccharide biosynthesis protein n=1 Tax=Mycolicibacterium hippocampi TaxID=659824 RepID=A0A850PZ43_9MYCO|nr:glycosyltransferase family 4 protein [Mycolicibacterium hippocampi]NVN52766.1 hypothetical protein [Mycolicibacterium hippocampi]